MSRYSDLTERFLRGEISLEDVQRVLQAVSNDAEFQSLVEEYKKLLQRLKEGSLENTPPNS